MEAYVMDAFSAIVSTGLADIMMPVRDIGFHRAYLPVFLMKIIINCLAIRDKSI